MKGRKLSQAKAMVMNMDLSDFRRRLDEIDSDLVALFLERMAVSREIGEYKRENGLAVRDASREEQIIKKNRAAASSARDADALEALYKLIFELSRTVQ